MVGTPASEMSLPSEQPPTMGAASILMSKSAPHRFKSSSRARFRAFSASGGCPTLTSNSTCAPGRTAFRSARSLLVRGISSGTHMRQSTVASA